MERNLQSNFIEFTLFQSSFSSENNSILDDDAILKLKEHENILRK